MSTDLEVSVEKKDKMFLKRLQLFFSPFVDLSEKGKLYKVYTIQREHSIPFMQLL